MLGFVVVTALFFVAFTTVYCFLHWQFWTDLLWNDWAFLRMLTIVCVLIYWLWSERA